MPTIMLGDQPVWVKFGKSAVRLRMQLSDLLIFTAQCYASVVYILSSCVHLFVRLLQAGIIPKQLNIRSCKQRRTIAEDTS